MNDARKPLDGMVVLIVDDNLDALDLLRVTLAYYGALTVTARSGGDALERLASVRVDVIISDISMPGSSGYDFIRAVRALPSPAGRNTPAIAITAFGGPIQRRLAMESGFQAYHLKPFDAAHLVEEIVRLAG